ncbi:unnamed protein product [Prorocentrum cordatum]|uniref:Kringle domain-containing protein n=1 Tax=Prorocentrum cordatum TaxID=2364126 RepID=A0ABN9TEJ9_9DINO|nr:unnamed protein product [Polarella glacialis]|mmetsp:Transcript_48243/g.137916  ORF Transcript_48243/g.137916 Transcript_48243/m.137916 type:complete len:703 (+) Transcript_48243:89-2197(+)
MRAGSAAALLLASAAAAASPVVVPFSLSDAEGRDLVAEAAALEPPHGLSGSGQGARHVWAALSPTPPLRLQFEAHGRSLDFRLYRTPPVFASDAVVVARGLELPLAAKQPVFRSRDHTAMLTAVGRRILGAVRIGSELLEIEADSIAGTLTVNGLSSGGERSATAWNVTGSGGRRLEFAPDQIEQWTDCYTNDASTRAMSMGVAVGTRLYTTEGILDSVDETLDWLQSIFAFANMIYTPQLNFVLTISDVYIPAASGETVSWDDCTLGIDSQLAEFSKWNQRSRQGLWHLFDNCHDLNPGPIGLANVGTTTAGVCEMDRRCYVISSGAPCVESYSNTGVSWYSDSTWKTFAHEVGHNFGANHAFENGQGSTGGIMDYGDGTLNGIFQFNTEFTKDDICTVISHRVDQDCEAITRYVAVCGDGMVDAAEECECDTGTSCAFCEDCLLAEGKECTPDGSDSQCCTSTGFFESIATQCTMPGGAGTGFCQLGTCQDTWCTNIDHPSLGDFCGLHPDNECKVNCLLNGDCNALDDYTWLETGAPINHREDGGLCSGGAGICIFGACVIGARATTSGCACEQSWSGEEGSCEDYCCNPDNDPGGEWCYTADSCSGLDWGYCAADSRSVAATPSTTMPSLSPTAAPTPGSTTGGGGGATPTPTPTLDPGAPGGDPDADAEIDQAPRSVGLGASALLAVAAGAAAAGRW